MWGFFGFFCQLQQSLQGGHWFSVRNLSVSVQRFITSCDFHGYVCSVIMMTSNFCKLSAWGKKKPRSPSLVAIIWCSAGGIPSGSWLVAFSLMSLRVKARCPLGLHVIGWQGLGIWVNFPAIMEISQAPETNRQETGRKYLNLHWPSVGTVPYP